MPRAQKQGTMPDKKFFNILLRLPALIIVAAIWILSSQSTLPTPKGILGFDKLQHLAAYAVLAAAAGLWVPREKWKSRGLFFIAIAASIASVYGIIDEVHQYFVPGRDANVWDWIADAAGSVIGAAAAGTGAAACADRRISKKQETA
jgi:VanZ family protein